MLLHPQVQERAQEEIDRIVGGDRLPDYGDKDSLPYLAAVLKEVMRSIYRRRCDDALTDPARPSDGSL